jgi:hypothetical protein
MLQNIQRYSSPSQKMIVRLLEMLNRQLASKKDKPRAQQSEDVPEVPPNSSPEPENEQQVGSIHEVLAPSGGAQSATDPEVSAVEAADGGVESVEPELVEEAIAQAPEEEAS